MSWVDLVRSSIRETHGYASLLTGRDDEAAVSLVHQAYATLAEARRQGIEVDAVGKSLRRVVRRRWIKHLADVPPDGKAHSGESRVLADLPMHVRTIVVLRTIDGMPSERVARETGVSAADVDRLYEQARTWLGEQGEDMSREWVHSHLGGLPEVPPNLVQSLVTEFGPTRADEPPRTASYSVGVGELDATPPRGRVVQQMDPTADIAAPEVVAELAEEIVEPVVESATESPAAKKPRGWARLKRHRHADPAPDPTPDPAPVNA